MSGMIIQEDTRAMSPDPFPSPPLRTHLAKAWRTVKSVLVFLFVTWNLVILAIRNPLDLLEPQILEWIDDTPLADSIRPQLDQVNNFTWKYVNLVGCEQRWVMFSPPMNREAYFPGFRHEFTDGSSALTKSAQEPDPASFFRVGGWQQRKLEDYLLVPPAELDNAPSWPLWEGFARGAIRKWKQQHSDDGRELKRLVLIKRRITFIEPDQPPGIYQQPVQEDVIAFDPNGKPWR